MSERPRGRPKLRGEDGYQVVSARIPNRLLRKLDETARRTGHNRNTVIRLALEYSLDRLIIIDFGEDSNEQSREHNERTI